MPPNLANNKIHWRTRKKWQDQYKGTLDYMLLRANAKKPPVGEYVVPPSLEAPFDHATVTVHLVLFNPMDDDNAMARMKFLMDWLVTRGYLVDDSRKHMAWSGIPTQEIRRDIPAYVELTIVPTTTSDPTTSGTPEPPTPTALP